MSNLDLRSLAAAQVGAQRSVSGVELFRLFPRGDLRLATAARMSASFPFVSPAAELPTDPPRRLVDAGYYDNYGVNLATRWIWAHRRILEDRACGVALVEIRDGPRSRERAALTASRSHPWYPELSSPVEGVLAARESTSGYRNDEQVAALRGLPGLHHVVIELLPDEDGHGPPTSWALTGKDRAALERGLRREEVRAALDGLLAWLASPPAPVSLQDP